MLGVCPSCFGLPWHLFFVLLHCRVGWRQELGLGFACGRRPPAAVVGAAKRRKSGAASRSLSGGGSIRQGWRLARPRRAAPIALRELSARTRHAWTTLLPKGAGSGCAASAAMRSTAVSDAAATAQAGEGGPGAATMAAPRIRLQWPSVRYRSTKLYISAAFMQSFGLHCTPTSTAGAGSSTGCGRGTKKHTTLST